MSNQSEPLDRKALLKNALVALDEMQARLDAVEQARREPIAIIGMSCRFPGPAVDPDAYWSLLHNGVDAVRPVPPERWDTSAYADLQLEHPIAWFGGFIDNIDQFDPQFFGISPREASSMDPQQRLALEVAWEALENAGLSPDRLSGSQSGVFMGVTTNDFAQLVRSGDPAGMDVYSATGSALNAVPGRIAYTLGLHGPSLAVDTACSSSLVAIHLACQSLRNRETELALAGGVNATLTPEAFICFSGWGMMAPDGRCKTFDATANGFVRGEGCGVLVLKRLSDAIAHGDRILAVIRGSAVNQDGRSSGLTVPNGRAQQAVIRRALENAGVKPAEISYVEAHGTGTALGDPIEIEAIGNALGEGRSRPLVVGSVKTNLGHLESASGVAGLIKVILSLRHEEIPPHLHFSERSARIPWPSFPIEVPVTPTPWPAGDQPRLAGVSSFGFSGTNAHIVITEAPQVETSPETPAAKAYLLPISARSEKALADYASKYARRLEGLPPSELAALCRTAALGRTHFPYRAAAAANTPEQMQVLLASLAEGETLAGTSKAYAQRTARGSVAFLFTGQGAQYTGMGRELYETQPVFRAALEQCDTLLRPYLEKPLLDVLYPAEGVASPLDDTTYTQPALFAVEWALAKLWQSWGVEPTAVMGHSVGEYVAACLAGVFSLEDGLRLIAARARLMGSLPPGGQMTAVFAGEADVIRVLSAIDGPLSIAAYNGPQNTVISGAAETLQAACAILEQEGFTFKALNVSHAFHSPLMETVLSPFEHAARQVSFNLPCIRLVSNLTGCEETNLFADPAYWRNHIRQPVRFMQSLQALYNAGFRLFVEIGPHPTLLGMGQRCLDAADETLAWLPSLRRGHEETQRMMESLGELYTRGAISDWTNFYAGSTGQPADLPTYPFQRERYWLEGVSATASLARHAANLSASFLSSPGLELAGTTGVHVWETVVSFERFPYLRDHRVQHTAVVPATAYIEMALEGARELWGAVPMRVTGIENKKVLLLSEEAAFNVQVVFTKQPSGGATYQIFSRPALPLAGAPTPWTLHSSGVIAVFEAADPARLDLEAFQARCTNELPVAEFYQAQHHKGNQWGPDFQRITRLWVGDHEALSQVTSDERETGKWVFHPALADSSGHVLVAALPTIEQTGSLSGAFVGGAIDEIRVYQSPRSRRLWAHAKLAPVQQEENILVGDVRVWDDQGNLISETLGAHLYYLDREAQEVLYSTLEDWFYEPAWTEIDLPERIPDLTGQRCLILADLGRPGAEPVGARLAERLRQSGASAELVYRLADRPLPEGVTSLPADQPEAYTTLLGNLLQQGPIDRIIHLWSLDIPERPDGLESTEEAGALSCGSLLLLAQALGRASLPVRPRVWLVTQNAQPVNLEQKGVSAGQAMLWGFGRSFASEYPDFWGGLVDLDAAAGSDESASQILHLFENHGSEDLLAVRGAVTYAGRLRRLPLSTLNTPDLQCRAGGAYLITGGMGGLGLLTAQHLVTRGARHLILVGRTPLPDRASWAGIDVTSRAGQRVAAIQALEAAGARVYPYAADVSSAGQVRDLLAQFRQEAHLPIYGVVHAAGVPQYQAMSEHSLDNMQAVLGAKVAGSWLLHDLLRNEPLDFFVLFSSASALLNSPFASSYAAANAFMDALAYNRKASGLPGLSINWGFWAKVGMVAEFGSQGGSAQRAMKLIAPRLGMRALECALQQEKAQVGIFPVDWTQWHSAESAGTAYLTELVEMQKAAAVQAGSSLIDRAALLQAQPDDRKHMLGDYVAQLVSSVLRIPQKQLDPRESITALGLDSLMALEIRNRLQADLQISIPIMNFLQGPSVESLQKSLLEQLGELASEASMDTQSAKAAQSSHQPEDNVSPQSYNQRSMWFTHLLAPNSPAYNVGLAVRVRSGLDLPRLRASVQAMVNRHTSLRTRFTHLEGEPVQVIEPAVKVDVEVTDASTWDETALRRRVKAGLNQPFDLENGPLLRVQVYRRAPNDEVLLIAAHHIVMDGWSIGIVLNELEALYAAGGNPEAAVLPTLALNYADFMSWQNRLLQSETGHHMQAYWIHNLSGELPHIQLPFDHPRPASQTFNGASHTFQLDEALTTRIKALVKSEGTTVFTVLLAGFNALLSAYSGQSEVITGVPVSGRSQVEFAPLIGNFINMVAMRIRCDGHPTFRDLLHQVRQQTMEALDNQDYPFPLLVERLGIHRENNLSPIFQVMFDFQRLQGFERFGPLFMPYMEEVSIPFGELLLQPFYLPQQEGQFDLTLQIAEAGDDLYGVLKYNPDLFDSPTILQMQRDLVRLLDELVTNPALPIPPLAFLHKDLPLAEFWTYYNTPAELLGKTRPASPGDDEREEFDL